MNRNASIEQSADASEVVRQPSGSPRSRAWGGALHTLLFVAGFSLVFVLVWGGAATLLGEVLSDARLLMSKVGGALVILFGLSRIVTLPIPWLYRELRAKRFERRTGPWPSFLLGTFFAAGWTPCVGPTLGAILMLGMAEHTVGQGMVLAAGFALGLGLPIVLLGLMVDRARRILGRLRRFVRWIEVASGLLLIGLGILLWTERLTRITAWAQGLGWHAGMEPAFLGAPTLAVAVLAGLFAFLSPCTLPLVPGYLAYLAGRTDQDRLN